MPGSWLGGLSHLPAKTFSNEDFQPLPDAWFKQLRSRPQLPLTELRSSPVVPIKCKQNNLSRVDIPTAAFAQTPIRSPRFNEETKLIPCPQPLLGHNISLN